MREGKYTYSIASTLQTCILRTKIPSDETLVSTGKRPQRPRLVTSRGSSPSRKRFFLHSHPAFIKVLPLILLLKSLLAGTQSSLRVTNARPKNSKVSNMVGFITHNKAAEKTVIGTVRIVSYRTTISVCEHSMQGNKLAVVTALNTPPCSTTLRTTTHT